MGAEENVWRRFRRSRFLPATVISGIMILAAALFAGSYTYAIAAPQPEDIPIAVVHSDAIGTSEFVGDLDTELNASVSVRDVDTVQAGRDLLAEQDVFGVLSFTSETTMTLDVASASGASVAQTLEAGVEAVAHIDGVTVTATDLHPLQDGDPHGLTLFYMTLAAIVVGFVGAVQLTVNAKKLNHWEHVAFVGVYAVLAGLAIVIMIDPILGALDLPFPESWIVLSLTMFASGMVFTMFNDFFGRWAMLPTWGLMILLGNPSSGGAVSWPLLPKWLALIGGWLPPGASMNAQHTAVYFPGHQHAWPFIVLALWGIVGGTVHVVNGRRKVAAAAADTAVVVASDA